MSVLGKVVIVTGARVGIGRAYALALAAAGATVIAASRNVAQGDDDSVPAEKYFSSLHERRCDLTDPAAVESLVAATLDQFGRIDVLINNAGVYPHHPSLMMSAQDWDDVMDVNVRGAYLMSRHVAAVMKAQAAGSIISLTSLAAERTPPGHTAHRDLLAYAVSKAALNRMTTYLAEDLRPYGIAVNAISPGAVMTDSFVAADPEVAAMARDTGWGKPATPEVMGPPILFLAEQTADTLTGQILHHDEFGISWP